MKLIELGELMPSKTPSLDPSRFPDETFELWSIPAFDVGRPEIAPSGVIGSAKKLVQPNDVLLSRIVPHIRRTWVVGPVKHHRQIASGEWIIFRGNQFYPDYLRHILISDPFHRDFMQTVAGIGGSLLRARPEGVRSIKIPLPPLEEQKRIAAILDQADALRRLRARALTRLNALGQAIFHEMFGDPEANEKCWPTACLEALVFDDDRINYGVVQPGDHDPSGVPIIRVADLTSKVVDFETVKRISPAIDQDYSRSRLKGGEILIGCVGSIGTTLIAPDDYKGANIARAVARVPVDPKRCNPVYLNAFLRTQAVSNYFLKEVRLVAQPTLNIKQIKETVVLLAPRELQDAFAERLATTESSQAKMGLAAKASENLFTSLQHRAFRGEL